MERSRKEGMRMSTSDRDLQAAIAVTRFGMGARPGEIATAAQDPKGWLVAQVRPTGAPAPAPTQDSGMRLAELRDFREARREAREAPPPPAGQQAPAKDDPVKAVQKLLRQDAGADFLARARLGATTPDGFAERWTLFFANHFTVSAAKVATATLVGPFENEAIRPHVFGRFGDLLAAAESHPAMLLYLDQAQSVGPNSPLAQRVSMNPAAQANPAAQRRNGLNENLAREILELHTVGVNGGYSQADVTEFARALTGISIRGPREAPGDGQPVLFRAAAHEPGPRTILGVHYAEGGREQGLAVLHDLAARPATARFVCHKIARHFVADDPSPRLMARLEKAWAKSDGDLGHVAEALITAPEAWEPTAAKFKTPYDFVISSYRAAGVQPSGIEKLAPILTALGQKPFSAPSPKGWPEEADAWAAPDAIVKRMQYAQAFAAVAAQGRDPGTLAAEALGARLRPATETAVARAESRPEGLALLLMSPEFQRR
jgi:uncharacterized protein (DUF1800 family)